MWYSFNAIPGEETADVLDVYGTVVGSVRLEGGKLSGSLTSVRPQPESLGLQINWAAYEARPQDLSKLVINDLATRGLEPESRVWVEADFNGYFTAKVKAGPNVYVYHILPDEKIEKVEICAWVGTTNDGQLLYK